MRLVVDRPGVLNPKHEALYRYASVLARMHTMRTPEGKDVEVASQLDELRRWMLESIAGLLQSGGRADIDMLREMAPVLALRLEQTRAQLLAFHVNDFGPEHLDAEIRNKTLVLVLGGGGGAGMFHLGVFSMFAEMNQVPELITGSSMGSIMGALRALDRDYDPIQTALAFPRNLDYNHVFRPFTGYSRFGFPGAFHVNLLRVSREVFQNLIGRSTLHFDELPIKLQVVVCGIRTGFHIDDAAYQSDAKSLNSLSFRSQLRGFFRTVRTLSKSPRFLAQIVFGKEEDTIDFPVIEAVGFSCAVPGLLHYDVYHDDPVTIRPLERIFENHQLLRMCDGGVVNNVPAQVAWDSVQQGAIGTRNAYIFSADVFAPISSGRNLIFVPVQQITRPGVVANKPYSDYHKTFRSPPSPLQVIVNQYSKLKHIVKSSRDELSEDEPYIRRALEPLPPYGVWN